MKKIIIILSLFLCLLSLALPATAVTIPEKTVDKCTGVGEFGALTFCPNVSLGPNMVKGTSYPVDTQTLGKYIQVWYGLIIGTVGILASIMIMYGGIKWLTSRGGSAVNEAKDIIISALIGLTLAFLSFTILYLINPNLLNIGLPGTLTAIKYDANFNLKEPYIDPSNSNMIVTQKGIALTGVDGGPRREGETTAQAIARNAQASVGASTSNAPRTNGGRLACAYTVNEIVRNANGEPINNALSTDAIADTLSHSSSYTAIPNANNNLNGLQPGDIIISPTSDSRLNPALENGHTGIYVGNGIIVSNSSGQGQIGTPYNATEWASHYGFFDAYRPK